MRGPKDLMILETMFCDNERDEEVLADYFRRFTHTLRSVLRQQLPQGLELLVTASVPDESVSGASVASVVSVVGAVVPADESVLARLVASEYVRVLLAVMPRVFS